MQMRGLAAVGVDRVGEDAEAVLGEHLLVFGADVAVLGDLQARPVGAVGLAPQLAPLEAAAHDAEGRLEVDGSSPSEGFTKGQQMAFLVALNRARRRIALRELSPRLVPRSERHSSIRLNRRSAPDRAPPCHGGRLTSSDLKLAPHAVQHPDRLGAARANGRLRPTRLRCASAADFGEDVREFARLVGPDPFAGEELAGNHQCIARLPTRTKLIAQTESKATRCL